MNALMHALPATLGPFAPAAAILLQAWLLLALFAFGVAYVCRR